MVTPYRSVLYLPGSRERVLEKAKTLKADALIFDLEDAVAPDEKPAARALVGKMVNEGGYGKRKILIRVNGLDTEWGAEDLAMVKGAKPHAVLLPKVESAAQIAKTAAAIEGAGTKIWAMIETPLGVMNAYAIAKSHSDFEGFVMGTNDLAKELRARHVAGRAPLQSSLSQAVLAARAAGIYCVDGVYNAFKDDEGLRIECQQGLDFGMDGKTLIHPAQVEISNEIFAPSADEIELCKRQVEAYEEALSRGEAVAVVDGKIVENLHVATAKERIALADAIAALEAE